MQKKIIRQKYHQGADETSATHGTLTFREDGTNLPRLQ